MCVHDNKTVVEPICALHHVYIVTTIITVSGSSEVFLVGLFLFIFFFAWPLVYRCNHGEKRNVIYKTYKM